MHAALVGVQIAFASLSVAGKVVVRTLDPSALALIRLAGGALVFGVLALARRERDAAPVPLRDVLAIAGCASLGIFGNQVLFLHGLRLTSAVNATVLVATIPIFTVLVAILLRREAARANALLGVLVAFAGVVWLVGGPRIDADGALGDLLVVGNSIGYAFYLVLVRDLARRHGSIRVVAIGFAAGALLALPLGVPALVAQAPSIAVETWWLVLYVVLVPTVFTYLANAWALRFASSSVVAIYVYVQPLFAAWLAWTFLDESPSPRVLVTGLAVFAGIWLVTRPALTSALRPAASGATPPASDPAR
ncbi:Permease of the drug/metabolite transporter (DMT) superfamily [Sandaracinus amylolyticus]|uniref:Permease of the drug/metabolite transporter (DMT) superfamily n=1 Tax=Sandaracinus amylolyticus TaxID=927083 RepID=A0A0F6YJS7_9BACT|nr:Permease of the drug/metabolite transporter (DMT) superfamily [Sandaracinus amylolyticus]